VIYQLFTVIDNEQLSAGPRPALSQVERWSLFV